MQILPIVTRIFRPPQDDLYSLLDTSLPALQEGDILLITSKILAIHQGRCVPLDATTKEALIKQEAEHILPAHMSRYNVSLTIKNHTLIPSAGIDESNADGHYILWPEHPEIEAQKMCEYLKDKFQLKKLAVIITDSHTTPMRHGVMGISIGFFGLNPVRDYRGQADIFGRTIQMSQTDVVDSLAAMAVLVMGEGDERKPLCIIRDADFVEFTDEPTYAQSLIALEDDIYFPLLERLVADE